MIIKNGEVFQEDGSFRLQDLYVENHRICLLYTSNEGKLSACVFTEPEMEPDDTYLLDYALFFSSVLLDYYEATGDLETLRDLYDVAIDQIRIAMTQLNEKNVVEDLGDAFWCFLDWGDGLNKQEMCIRDRLYSLPDQAVPVLYSISS